MDIVAEVGKAVLWVGAEAVSWGPDQIAAAAKQAHALGFDTICVKRAEGTQRWYNTPEQLKAERAAALAAGCGFVAMHYSDGPKFGPHFDEAEAAVILEMLGAAQDVQIDMEAEWDGAAAVAQEFAARFVGHPGNLLITSWANPAAHAWNGVAQALRLVTQAWVPQVYNDYLAAVSDPQLSAAGESPIMVGIDLTQEFGANHQADIIRQAQAHGHTSIWFWEYGPAVNNPTLTKQLVAQAHGSSTPPLPPPPPPAQHSYVVQAGDTLSGIAAKLGLGSWYHNLYQPNLATIEQAARAHRQPDSNGGSLIYAGTVLHY